MAKKQIVKKEKSFKISEVYSNEKRMFNIYDHEGKVVKSFTFKKDAEDFISKN